LIASIRKLRQNGLLTEEEAFYYLLIASISRGSSLLHRCKPLAAAFYYLLIASPGWRRGERGCWRRSFLLSLDCVASGLRAAAEAFTPLSIIS